MKNKIILDNIKNDKEFFNEYQTMKLLKSNNIMRERVELYRDFSINLMHYVHTTYFGREYIKTEEDIKGHYNWAFNKVLSDFEKEGIVFAETKELRGYFFTYFTARLYSVENVPALKTFTIFWDDIFVIKPNKEKNHLNALIEIYKLFDSSLSRKIILENIL